MKDFANLNDLKTDMSNNPNKYLDDQGRVSLIGEKTSAICPICKTQAQIEILNDTSGKCLHCKNTVNIKV